jgi:hypothetical protein
MRKRNSLGARRAYIGYIVVGALYVVVKALFVSMGYLHPGAIIHALIPAVMTIVPGALALRDNGAGFQRLFWHRVTAVVPIAEVPILIFITTPLYMYLRQGEEWLSNGRFPVLALYEFLAIVQIAIAAEIRRQRVTSGSEDA